jgi:hypothetical protein
MSRATAKASLGCLRDWERQAAGVDEDLPPRRLSFDEDAQIRMAHWLAQWGMPLLILAAVAGLALLWS